METTQNQQLGSRPPGWYENYIPRYMAFLDEVYKTIKRSGGQAVKLPGAELMAAHKVEGRSLLVADELGIIIRERRGWYKWGLEGEPGSAEAIKILRRCTELRDEYTQRRRDKIEAMRKANAVMDMELDDPIELSASISKGPETIELEKQAHDHLHVTHRLPKGVKPDFEPHSDSVVHLYGYPIGSPKATIEILYRELDAAREQLQARRWRISLLWGLFSYERK